MRTNLRRQSSVRASRAVAHETVAMTTAARKPRQTKIVAPAVAEETEHANPADSLSAKAKRAIETARPSFLAFISTHGNWSAKRSEVVAPFAKALRMFKEETHLGLADFVRQFVPDVPRAAADYKKHSAYNAADHIMRLYREQERARLAKEDTTARPKKVTPIQGMARVIAAMLPLISADQVDKLWDVAQAQLVGWSEQSVKNLRELVDKSAPLMSMRPPRGMTGAVPALRIANPPRVEAHEAEEEAAPRTGTHG